MTGLLLKSSFVLSWVKNSVVVRLNIALLSRWRSRLFLVTSGVVGRSLKVIVVVSIVLVWLVTRRSIVTLFIIVIVVIVLLLLVRALLIWSRLILLRMFSRLGRVRLVTPLILTLFTRWCFRRVLPLTRLVLVSSVLGLPLLLLNVVSLFLFLLTP